MTQLPIPIPEEMFEVVYELFAPSHTDLYLDFKKLIDSKTDGSGAGGSGGEWCAVPLSEIDFTQCRKCTPSYRYAIVIPYTIHHVPLTNIILQTSHITTIHHSPYTTNHTLEHFPSTTRNPSAVSGRRKRPRCSTMW